MFQVIRLGDTGSFAELARLVGKGSMVVIDNGYTGALVGRAMRPLMEFKERPDVQALSVWGDLQHYWNHFRDFRFYADAPGVTGVVSTHQVFEGKSFLRFKLHPLAVRFARVMGLPQQAIKKELLQVYSSGTGHDIFAVMQRTMLAASHRKYIWVTSTNKRGDTPARGEEGLCDWASKWNLPLFLLPPQVRADFDMRPSESFPIVEADKDGFVVRRQGCNDMYSLLQGRGVPVRIELDTK